MMNILKLIPQNYGVKVKCHKAHAFTLFNHMVIVMMLLGSTGAYANLNGKMSSRYVPKPPVSVPSATSNLRSSFGGAYQLNPPQYVPSNSQHRPPHHQPPPHYPHPPSYPHSHPNSGITVIYQQSLPTTTQYRYVNQAHVYGSESGLSQSTVIVDWHQSQLPAPARGMHWIFENGRYLQVPYRR